MMTCDQDGHDLDCCSAPPTEIVVYWRPGCLFCSSLLRQLAVRRVPHRRVDIWQDPNAAARVRSAADGNETVPTVEVGPIMLVNPDIHTVLAAATEHVPHAVPESYEPPRPGRFGRWLLSKLSGTPNP
jgi:glutaredoxin